MNSRALRSLVLDTAAEVLGVTPEDIAGHGDLTVFSTYTSFRVLDIVESLERRLAVEVEPDDLVPANLRRVDSLCRMFESRIGAAPTAAKETADG